MNYLIKKPILLIFFIYLFFLLAPLPFCRAEPSVYEEFTSPLLQEVRPWLIGGTVLSASARGFKKEIVDPLQKDFSENKPLGNWAAFGDYGGQFITNSLYSLGMWTAYKWTHQNDFWQKSKVMIKASLYAVTVSTLLKITVQESRPNDPNDRKSFPSGHTTAAFAFSTVIICEHGFFPYGMVATSLSFLTGLSRINDNKHYLHDVIAGATIGTVYGLGIFQISHPSVYPSSSQQSSSLHFIPIVNKETYGVTVLYNW